MAHNTRSNMESGFSQNKKQLKRKTADSPERSTSREIVTARQAAQRTRRERERNLLDNGKDVAVKKMIFTYDTETVGY